MFALYHYKRKDYPFNRYNPLSALGSVSLGASNPLGKNGDFIPIVCRRKGQVHRLHISIDDVKIAPQGVSFDSTQYGDRSEAHITLTESQERELLNLIKLHESELALKYDDMKDSPHMITEVLTTGGVTLQVKMKSTTQSDSLWEGNATLEDKVRALNGCTQSVSVALFVSGYYYSTKQATARLCISLEEVNTGKNKNKKKRHLHSITAGSDIKKMRK